MKTANHLLPCGGRVPKCNVYVCRAPIGARRRGSGSRLEERGKTIFYPPDRAAFWIPGVAAVAENFTCRLEYKLRHRQFPSTRDNPNKCIWLQQFALKSLESWFSFSSCLNMESKYVVENWSVGTGVGGADFNCRTGRSVLRDTRVPSVEKSGSMSAYANGPVHYKTVMDGVSAAEVKSERTSLKGNGLSLGGRILHDVEKVSAVQLFYACALDSISR